MKEPEDIAVFNTEFDPTLEACAALQRIEQLGYYIEPEILDELISSITRQDYADAWIYISKYRDGRTIHYRRTNRALDPQHRALPRKERNERQRKKLVSQMQVILEEIRAQKSRRLK